MVVTHNLILDVSALGILILSSTAQQTPINYTMRCSSRSVRIQTLCEAIKSKYGTMANVYVVTPTAKHQRRLKRG